MISLGVFLVTGPRHPGLNVIVTANTRETAKGLALSVLGGDSDQYTVTPVTRSGQRTIFLTATETISSNGIVR